MKSLFEGKVLPVAIGILVKKLLDGRRRAGCPKPEGPLWMRKPLARIRSNLRWMLTKDKTEAFNMTFYGKQIKRKMPHELTEGRTTFEMLLLFHERICFMHRILAINTKAIPTTGQLEQWIGMARVSEHIYTNSQPFSCCTHTNTKHTTNWAATAAASNVNINLNCTAFPFRWLNPARTQTANGDGVRELQLAKVHCIALFIFDFKTELYTSAPKTNNRQISAHHRTT